MSIISINCCPVSTQKPLSSVTPTPTITKTNTPTPTQTITPTPSAEPVNIVINGSLENSLSNWTFSSVDYNYYGFDRYFVDLNACGIGYISQTITTIPGQNYVIYFDLSGNCGVRFDNNVADKVMKLTLTGTNIILNKTYTYTCPSYGFQVSAETFGWNTISETFTANSNSTLLKFESISPGGCFGPMISRVSGYKI
jgi:hypothetical protein